jgi:hypothetical protein
MSARPVPTGSWADALCAIRFYEKHGHRVPARPETEALPEKRWTSPERQIATSVVLARPRWKSA